MRPRPPPAPRSRPLTRALVLVAATASLAAAGLLAACVASDPDRPARGAPPPAPLPEYRTPPPAPGMVWVAGAWHWDGVDYVWVPGRWESPPATPGK